MREGQWMAAVLGSGEGAVLSHQSAAALWGVGKADSEIEVTVPSRRRPRVQGVRIHRRELAPDEVAERDGIPVTSPVLTLIDFASVSPTRGIERAVSAADRDDLIDPESLREVLDRCPRRQGVGALKQLLDRYTLVLTESELERLFVPIARRAGLPRPVTQQWLNGERVDFYWPELGLVVETDGLRYHRTPAQQAKDRRRDQKHTAAGLTPLRFTHAQVAHEPAFVEGILRRTAGRLRSLDA
jgi:very-short-patch-repair endonuclease